MSDPMQYFNDFKFIVETSFTAFLIPMDFMGMLVRPLDFILFTGGLTLLFDLFRLVVMRGQGD